MPERHHAAHARHASHPKRGRTDKREHDDHSESRTVGPRSLWSGVLSFGLVSVPVDVYPAVRDARAHLRLFDDEGAPLSRLYYCPEHDTEVTDEHLVRGFPVDDGRYVVVTDEELEALDPKKSREIDLRLFVERDSLDPVYFDHPYFLVPGSESTKAYRLLAAVMESTGRAGIATFVMRGKEYLIAIFSERGVLKAETMRFQAEVRSVPFKGAGRRLRGRGASARAANASTDKRWSGAIKRLHAEHLPTAELTDDHADAIRALAEKKYRGGRDVVRAPEAAESSGREDGASPDVIDLMDQLKRSLEADNDTHGRALHGHAKRGASARRSRRAQS